MGDFELVQHFINDWIEDGNVNQPIYLEFLDINTLPDLPYGLRYLYIRNMHNLTVLPKLPDTLRILHILNAPAAPWHKNKFAGDFTAYGD